MKLEEVDKSLTCRRPQPALGARAKDHRPTCSDPLGGIGVGRLPQLSLSRVRRHLSRFASQTEGDMNRVKIACGKDGDAIGQG